VPTDVCWCKERAFADVKGAPGNGNETNCDIDAAGVRICTNPKAMLEGAVVVVGRCELRRWGEGGGGCVVVVWGLRGVIFLEETNAGWGLGQLFAKLIETDWKSRNQLAGIIGGALKIHTDSFWFNHLLNL
jgi:hypothetical protein